MSTLLDENEVATPALVEEPELVGLLAEYKDVDAILRAARGVRNARFKRWDVHSPFPIHGIDSAMGVKPTVLPRRWA